MDDFLSQLLKPIFIFIIGLLIGIFKAYTKQSVLSRKGELLSYHQYLKKPVFWTFLIMFILVVLLGFGMQMDIIEIFQKALITGLYAAGAVYIFMIWGANLTKS
jgi:ABC-type dipeptide/oligopeptide/nickel transport system permease component